MSEFLPVPLSKQNFHIPSETIEQLDMKSQLSTDQSKAKTHKNRRISRGRHRNRLPENYHQKVVELENDFVKFENFEVITELVNLYKVGVEYYSDRSLDLQQDYMDRMRLFLSNKNVLKLIMKTSPHPTLELPQQRAHSYTISTVNVKKRQSQILSLELEKLNFRNSSKYYKKSMNDFIRKFDSNITKACIKLEHSIKMQTNEFMEKLKIKKFNKFMKSDSKLNERNQKFMKRKSIESYNRSANTSGRSKLFKTISFKRTLHFDDDNETKKSNHNKEDSCVSRFKETDCINNSKIISKKINKQKNKHIGIMVESYLNNIYSTFSNKFCEPAVNKLIEQATKNFQSKKENFTEYYDSRAEIEIMLLDNPNRTSRKLYKQLIDSMRIDYDKFLIEINQSENNSITQLIKEANRNNLSNDSDINKLSEEFIVNLISVFK